MTGGNRSIGVAVTLRAILSAVTRRLLFGLCAVLALMCVSRPFAQEREDRTLRSHEQMRVIVSEASGERAMHHVTCRATCAREQTGAIRLTRRP